MGEAVLRSFLMLANPPPPGAGHAHAREGVRMESHAKYAYISMSQPIAYGLWAAFLQTNYMGVGLCGKAGITT